MERSRNVYGCEMFRRSTVKWLKCRQNEYTDAVLSFERKIHIRFATSWPETTFCATNLACCEWNLIWFLMSWPQVTPTREKSRLCTFHSDSVLSTPYRELSLLCHFFRWCRKLKISSQTTRGLFIRQYTVFENQTKAETKTFFKPR